MGRLPPILTNYSAHLAVQVHDELVFWVPEKNALPFTLAAKAVMESVVIPHLRLKVEGGSGRRWSDAK
jgi:DNA polymerase I-like protein with 3'-5' exonuclease and polymerase domains